MSANAWTEWLHDLLGMSHHNGLFSVGHGQTDTILGGNGHHSLLYFNSPSRVAGGHHYSAVGVHAIGTQTKGSKAHISYELCASVPILCLLTNLLCLGLGALLGPSPRL